MPEFITTETDGHIHKWKKDYNTTSVNIHADESTPYSFHVHEILGNTMASSRNESGIGWHTHDLLHQED